VRLWIDTDVGTNPDDAVALVCADAHPEVDLVGVSIVGDDQERRAAIARELVGAPVFRGDQLSGALVRELDSEAVLAIGPLTNVASIVAQGYTPPKLALMGGALGSVRHRGAVRAVEHNFGSDPSAAAAVLTRLDGVLVCPLDVTARMRLDAAGLERLSRLAPRIGEIAARWLERQRVSGISESDAVVCLHDPLALLAMVGEPVVATEERALGVSVVGALTERRDARSHEVVVDVDVDAACDRIFGLLADRRR